MKSLILNYTHGDEHPPKEWLGYVSNPRARSQGVRYTETDLNRSFNVEVPLRYEELRAEELKEIMSHYDIIYDIHRTRVKTKFCAFVTDENHIFYARKLKPYAIILTNDKSNLISHAKIGIGLEFPPEYKYHDTKAKVYRFKGFSQIKNHYKELEENEDGIPYLVGAYGGKCIMLANR